MSSASSKCSWSVKPRRLISVLLPITLLRRGETSSSPPEPFGLPKGSKARRVLMLPVSSASVVALPKRSLSVKRILSLYLVESPNVQLDDELCVLYVATTRAKRKVYIPVGLKPYFDNVIKN